MSEKLNCWPGCLAMVVKSQCGNEGKVVECGKLAELGEEIVSECGTSVLVVTHGGEHVGWHTETPMKWGDGCYYKVAKDRFLRPLRDDEGEDEMLRIAGLPNKETTPAAH